MGIGIDVGMNQDYSYLFQGASGGGSNLNFLSDYASIKNGSYGKLLKTYYGTVNNSSTGSSERKSGTNNVLDQILEEKKYPKVSKETQEANEKLTTGISSLQSTVATLRGENTYKASEDGTTAADKVASALKDYVSQYNEVVKAAKDSTLTGKTSHVAGMMKASQTYADKLAEVGITVNSDGTLYLDEGTLKKTDISKVQELFSKDNVTSYGSVVASRLNFAGIASNPVSKTEEKEVEEEKAADAGASSLKADIEKLLSNSLYEKVKGEDGRYQYDVDKLFAAAKNFVDNYNSMLKDAASSANSGVIANLARIMEKTEQNKGALEKFGISVDKKGGLQIDEEAFRKSDMSQLQDFFKDYGSDIATNVSLVNYYMTTQADAANGYTESGTYNAQGNLRYDAFV